MEPAAFRLTAEFEASHWWFLSRRQLVMEQVRLASADLQVDRPLRILDYGCGTGYLLRFLDAYGEAVGADIPTVGGEEVRGDERPFIDLSRDLSDHFDRYDLVMLLDVLEHFEDDLAGLERVVRLIHPGGELVVTVPAYSWLWSGEDDVSGHHRRYTATRLRAVAEKTGLEVQFISYFNVLVLLPIASVIWFKKLFIHRGRHESDVGEVTRWLNSLLTAVTGWENRAVGRQAISPPVGASIVMRARRLV